MVLNDGRNENELLDCSMESTGEESTKSIGGGGESILDESVEESGGESRVSFETSFDSKQPKLEPKLVSALSET